MLSIVPEEEEPVDLFESPDRTIAKRAPSSKSEPEDLFADATPDTTLTRRRKKSVPAAVGAKQNEWDSPLLLIGGGAWSSCWSEGLFIGYLLNREDADQILEQAAAYFDNGSYTQAIAQYEKFVANFPYHAQASEAKVHLGIARLWKATQDSTQYEKALRTTLQVLEEDRRGTGVWSGTGGFSLALTCHRHGPGRTRPSSPPSRKLRISASNRRNPPSPYAQYQIYLQDLPR